MHRIAVAVLGATGAVGQKIVRLLEGHPYFTVAEVVASERSAGKPYREAVHWLQETAIPENVAPLQVLGIDASLASPIVFSGLDASVAGEVEVRLAAEGHTVVSNSRNHRLDPDVPLVIPEINVDHLALLGLQSTTGGIITNSNCSTMFLAMALAPLHRAFGVRAATVTTLQAISGAGYPGVPSVDILGNVIPFISGEEEKLRVEPRKILGTLHDGGSEIEPAAFAISATCIRVPVVDGHTESIRVWLEEKPSIEAVGNALASFRGPAEVQRLPSAPEHPILVTSDPLRPQPTRDVWNGKGMSTTIGRLEADSVADIRFVALGHNTVRGAAGAAILNAEACVELGYRS